MLRGRDFEWADRKGAANVVIVNEAFAREAYPNTDPVGKIVRLQAPHEIVGVVSDSNNSAGDAYGMGQTVEPAIYIPFQQQQKGLWGTMTLSVRTESNLLSLMPAVGRVITEIDPKVAVDPIEPNSHQVIFRVREVRMTLVGLALFALIALLQASVGIYGTLSYFVSRRTFEIGLRMALGAKRQDVVRMVVRQSVAPVGIGILLGLAGTPFLERLMQNSGALVGHVVMRDQLAIVGIVSALFLSALLAAFTPAWRASRLAPMQALRHD
jgi:ABC-type antimicrobial peptide transport system permease subunit